MIRFHKNWARKRSDDANWPVLTGLRVILRLPRIDDYHVWRIARARNQEFLQEWEPLWPQDCLSPKFFQRRLARQMQEYEQRRSYSFMIFDQDERELIGGLNINNIVYGVSRQGWLGYWLDKERQGQGYMAEALRLVMDYGFDHIGLHRFNAACLPHNTRSANLLLRQGFTEEGYARNYICINGIWQDHRLFGYCAEDRDSASGASL